MVNHKLNISIFWHGCLNSECQQLWHSYCSFWVSVKGLIMFPNPKAVVQHNWGGLLWNDSPSEPCPAGLFFCNAYDACDKGDCCLVLWNLLFFSISLVMHLVMWWEDKAGAIQVFGICSTKIKESNIVIRPKTMLQRNVFLFSFFFKLEM